MVTRIIKSSVIAMGLLLSTFIVGSIHISADNIPNEGLIYGRLNVSVREVLLDNEKKDVYFYFQTNNDSYSYMLYQEDKFVCKLLDSGNYSADGDDIKGDGIFSGKITIDTSKIDSMPENKIISNVYHVSCQDKKVSNDVTVELIVPFSQVEIDEITKVDNAIEQLTSSEEYILMSGSERRESIIDLLNRLYNEGLINSIVSKDDKIEFLYSSGVQGVIMIDKFSDTIDGTAPTSSQTDTTYNKTVKATLKGDADLNDMVELADITTLAKYTLNSDSFPLISETACANADMNNDGKVNGLDTSALIENQLGK